jgi:NADH:ubiquinone oxidoreductase subunit 3 (subunit A)
MNINNNYATSITMDLENLQKRYSNTLIKYRQASTDYINYLNSQTRQPNVRPPLVSVNNSSYLGRGSAGPIIRTSNANQCRAKCASNSKCTGATFVSGSCNLRTGDSAVVPTKNSIAIISRGKQLLMNMDILNRELISINNEIRNKISAGTPVYKDFNNANNIKSQELSKQYSALNKERNNIKNLLDKYDKIENGQDENTIRLNQNYYTYFLLFIVAGFLIFLLIKLSYSGTQSGGNIYYIIFILIVILIIINYANKQFL